MFDYAILSSSHPAYISTETQYIEGGFDQASYLNTKYGNNSEFSVQSSLVIPDGLIKYNPPSLNTLLLNIYRSLDQQTKLQFGTYITQALTFLNPPLNDITTAKAVFESIPQQGLTTAQQTALTNALAAFTQTGN